MRIDPTTPDGAREALEMMWTIRRFEEGVEELYARGMLHGTMHLSIGQEAVAVGVVGVLEDDDYFTSTHRGHGHCLVHGADPVRMLAELLGRDTGYCRGRGGSMHIADVERGNLGANGIVAGSMTIAVGAAFALKQRGSTDVVVCFFGDGAANEGSFHEALNLAAIWDLPVVFVCENNQYGMSMSADKATAGDSIAGRASAYGIPGEAIDGNDVPTVHNRASEAVELAREGGGPTLIECLTYRYRGHSRSDRNLYRTAEEIEEWQTEKDPLLRMEGRCLEEGWLTQEDITAVRDRARERIREAAKEAVRGPVPDPASLEGAAYAS